MPLIGYFLPIAIGFISLYYPLNLSEVIVIGNGEPEKVLGLSNGNFAVVWRTENLANIQAQLFDPKADKIGSAFSVADSLRLHSFVAATSLSGGCFAVAWISDERGVYKSDLYISGFGSTGDQIFNTFISSEISYFDIASFPNGNFVAVWSSEGLSKIVSQVFSGDGNKIDAAFTLIEDQVIWYDDPRVMTLSNEKFIAFWYVDPRGLEDDEFYDYKYNQCKVTERSTCNKGQIFDCRK